MSLSCLDEFESFPVSDETMVKHSVVSDLIAKLCLFPLLGTTVLYFIIII